MNWLFTRLVYLLAKCSRWSSGPHRYSMKCRPNLKKHMYTWSLHAPDVEESWVLVLCHGLEFCGNHSILWTLELVIHAAFIKLSGCQLVKVTRTCTVAQSATEAASLKFKGQQQQTNWICTKLKLQKRIISKVVTWGLNFVLTDSFPQRIWNQLGVSFVT